MNEVMVYMAETSPKLLDYMPHIIAGLSVITTLIITVLQIINSARAYKKNSAYDVKKEAIYEALNFLDTYISWLDINSCSSITRQETDNIELTVSARNIHNKLCLTCDNEKGCRAGQGVPQPGRSTAPVSLLCSPPCSPCVRVRVEYDVTRAYVYISFFSP